MAKRKTPLIFSPTRLPYVEISIPLAALLSVLIPNALVSTLCFSVTLFLLTIWFGTIQHILHYLQKTTEAHSAHKISQRCGRGYTTSILALIALLGITALELQTDLLNIRGFHALLVLVLLVVFYSCLIYSIMLLFLTRHQFKQYLAPYANRDP